MIRRPAHLFVLFGPLSLAALTACGDPGKAAAATTTSAKRPLVRVAPIEIRKVRREIETTAWLESEHEVRVLAEVAGRVEEVLVDEGERVDKGQILARLDRREAQAALTQVEVQKQAAEVALQLAKLEVEAAQSRTEQLRIEFERTEADLNRQRSLAADVVSPKVLEDAQYARDGAEKAWRVSEFNARKAKLDADRAENAIAEAAAKLEETRLRLEDHDIRAPIAGVVAQRMIKGGETISTASELFVVLDEDNLISYMQRPQIELPLVRDAKQVVFTTDAFPGQEFHGDIDLISPFVDRENGSFKIRMRVSREHVDRLRSGMFIRVRILTEDLRDALMVPKASVLAEADKTVVFAVRDERAHRITVRTGLEQQDWIESLTGVDDGLVPGDVVVVSGQDDLKDQDRVDLAKD